MTPNSFDTISTFDTIVVSVISVICVGCAECHTTRSRGDIREFKPEVIQ